MAHPGWVETNSHDCDCLGNCEPIATAGLSPHAYISVSRDFFQTPQHTYPSPASLKFSYLILPKTQASFITSPPELRK